MPTYPEVFTGTTGRNYTRDGHGHPTVTAKSYVVIHNTGGTRLTSAADEASYATMRTDVRSAHYYADKRQVLQSLDTDWRAWHLKSRPGNDQGIAYELTGWTSFSRDRWLEAINWDALALQIARDAIAHHIQVQPLTITQIRTGKDSGIITADQARQAWGGTQRSGPGVHFPMDHLLRLVREKLTRLHLEPPPGHTLRAAAPPALLPPPTAPTWLGALYEHARRIWRRPAKNTGR